MVTKKDCIDTFNAMIRGTPVKFDKVLLPMYSEYLTENNIENYDKLINLVVQNPQLMQEAIPTMVEYFCRKYNILSLKKFSDSQSLFNNLITILYYE